MSHLNCLMPKKGKNNKKIYVKGGGGCDIMKPKLKKQGTQLK